MPDQVLQLGNSEIQHGPANDRVYVMKLDKDNPDQALTEIEKLADREGYSKIFAKAPATVQHVFVNRGYTCEAHIPHYYRGDTDLFFMSRFLDKEREKTTDAAQRREVLQLARQKAEECDESVTELPASCEQRVCNEGDIPQIVDVYRHVFESYPFPIHDPGYIAKTMAVNVTYFGIWEDGKLIALASAERDLSADSVEMTDFATLPPARGRGLGVYLLQQMEQEMKRAGVCTAYTIARAVSAGMNIVFAKQGYQFGGTLINNTDICGTLESMNIWWKRLG